MVAEKAETSVIWYVDMRLTPTHWLIAYWFYVWNAHAETTRLGISAPLRNNEDIVSLKIHAWKIWEKYSVYYGMQLKSKRFAGYITSDQSASEGLI